MAFSIRSSGLSGSLSEKRMYGLGAETPGTLHIGVQGKQGDPGVPGPRGPVGQDGITPTIGENGNWFIGDFDTGLPSRGKDVTEEEIEAAIAKYFEENPPSTGDVSLAGYAKEEWVNQNFQPKGNYLTEHQDISGKLDANKLPEAINTALALAKESGEFNGDKGDKGDPGQSIKGDKGDTGAAGYSPVRGTDYWTAADIAEIKSYVDDAILGGAW